MTPAARQRRGGDERGSSKPMAKKAVMSNPNTRQETQRELAGNATDAETVKQNIAKAVITPALAAARVILNTEGQNGLGARLDLLALTESLNEQAAKVRAGNLAQVETMLLSQATALQSLFARLVERGMGADLMPHYETHLRLALRAQAQSTRTLEVLANLKNPPVVIAKQANIAQGHQQVNNGLPADDPGRAREIEKSPNKLLEELPSERLDTGTAATTSGGDSEMATVGAVHRTEVGNR